VVFPWLGNESAQLLIVTSILLQVKSKLFVSFRTRHVKVIVPEFIAEAEQQLLGAALKQWQSSAEGVVASSILEVKVAEQRLLHAVYRCCDTASFDMLTSSSSCTRII